MLRINSEKIGVGSGLIPRLFQHEDEFQEPYCLGIRSRSFIVLRCIPNDCGEYRISFRTSSGSGQIPKPKYRIGCSSRTGMGRVSVQDPIEFMISCRTSIGSGSIPGPV